MPDLFNTEENKTSGSNTEFFLATVTGWSNASGVTIQIDGQSAMTKAYKMMLMCRPFHIGTRVVVMKHSGTYIVLGEISNPNSWQKLPDLSSGASLSDVISKVNAILSWLRTQGILWYD